MHVCFGHGGGEEKCAELGARAAQGRRKVEARSAHGGTPGCRHGSEITIDQASIEEVQEDLVEIDSVEPIEEDEEEDE